MACGRGECTASYPCRSCEPLLLPHVTFWTPFMAFLAMILPYGCSSLKGASFAQWPPEKLCQYPHSLLHNNVTMTANFFHDLYCTTIVLSKCQIHGNGHLLIMCNCSHVTFDDDLNHTIWYTVYCASTHTRSTCVTSLMYGAEWICFNRLIDVSFLLF